MSQDFRLENVGLINRDKKLSFKFNGKKYLGYEGDTEWQDLIEDERETQDKIYENTCFNPICLISYNELCIGLP